MLKISLPFKTFTNFTREYLKNSLDYINANKEEDSALVYL